MSALVAGLTYAVTAGDNIPAHDRTFDLVEEIAERLQAFRDYVAEVRDDEQADAALLDLAAAITTNVYDVTR